MSPWNGRSAISAPVVIHGVYRYRALWLIAGWILVAAVTFLSLAPIEADLSEGRDKWSHLLAYGSLMFWFGMLYRQRISHFYLAQVFVIMGISLEYLQGMTGYRNFDLADMFANAVGVALGWLLVLTPMRKMIALMDKWLDVVIQAAIKK